MPAWQDKDTGPEYDLGVVIGRFQPFHNGHLNLIKNALKHSREVLVLIGSCHQPRTIKNPFTGGQRMEMIHGSLIEDQLDGTELDVERRSFVERLHYEQLTDYAYSDQDWIVQVQGFIEKHNRAYEGKVAIFGHHKDDSSYYLDLFPQYDYVGVTPLDVMNATDLRYMYFSKGLVAADMPAHGQQIMRKFKSTQEYKDLVDEWNYIEDYKRPYSVLPFPPTFVTTDAVVLCGGHVLMVKRRFIPGKGLWALPGGFLNQNERTVDGAIRELLEETRIKYSKEDLINCIRNSRVFDKPDRSLRGRTITHAYLIQLQATKLPKVRGSDDAERAKWIPINKFLGMQEQIFEDHYSIVNFFLNRAV